MFKGALDLDDIQTVVNLAARVGGRKQALDLLRALDIPVVAGVFSHRLLLSRLEHRPVSQDAADRAAAALTRFGFVVIRIQRGHPTRLTVAVRDRSMRIGQPEYGEEEDGPFTPLVIRPGDRCEALLYIANARTSNGTAAFGLSGLDDEKGPPLVCLYLVAEDRLWLPLRSELREFFQIVGGGGRQPWFTQTPRKGGLRVSLPKSKNDLDAELRAYPVEP